MRIYTKKGDEGKTFNPITKSDECKHDELFQVIGDMDELQSWIGFLRSKVKDKEINDVLKEVQNWIYAINSHLVKKGEIEFKDTGVKKLEEEIDRMWNECGEIRKFLLPSGSESSCIAQIARAVCRRAERRLVEFYEKNKWIDKNVLKYMNRLSDYLFALARYLNKLENVKEEFAGE